MGSLLNTTLADLSYIKDDYEIVEENDFGLLFGGKPFAFRVHTLPIHDVRGLGEDDFTLDKNGFCFRSHESKVSFFEQIDEESDMRNKINADYGAELEPLLRKEFPDATKILFFGTLMRIFPRLPEGGELDKKNYYKNARTGQPPAPVVHIDWTAAPLPNLISDILDAEDAAYVRDSGRRYIALSMWKPLKRITRDPLAVMDARTLGEDEAVVVPRLGPKGGKFENLLIKSGEKVQAHKWYWKSEMETDEMIWIKLADSMPGEQGVAGSPHSSFVLQGTEEEPTRQSVEMRVVVVL